MTGIVWFHLIVALFHWKCATKASKANETIPPAIQSATLRYIGNAWNQRIMTGLLRFRALALVQYRDVPKTRHGPRRLSSKKRQRGAESWGRTARSRFGAGTGRRGDRCARHRVRRVGAPRR